jgi:hypothetical protein
MFCMATLLAWLALTGLGLVHLADVHLPVAAVAAAVALAAPTVLAEAARALLAIRRGPRLVEFEWSDAVMCAPQDAKVVRAAAQLRGTMGGAGHLHPRRLVLAAAAWALAAASGLEAIADDRLVLGAWPPVLTLVAALLAFMFPARAFYYREVTGGAVVTSPPTAAGYLLARRSGALEGRASVDLQ